MIQGLAGGGLQPCSQGVLLDTFPPEKQGVAMTLFGLAALIAPVVGPTLGGWITDQYSWRWIFLINVPVGLLALVGCYAKLRDPDYLIAQREALKKQPFRFDSIGLSLLVVVMVSWEVMLSKGQEWDWLGDPFWRVQTLAVFFAVGLVALSSGSCAPQPRRQFPAVARPQLRRLLHHHLLCLLALYGASTSLPGLLQSLFGYDALSAGLVMSPGGVFALLAMPVVGIALGRGLDARWLIAGGLLAMTAGNYWMSQLNLDISPGQVIWPRVVLVAGLAICFAPANVAAYLYIPKELRGAAVGLLSLLRNEGGSVGTSSAQAILERRDHSTACASASISIPSTPAQGRQGFIGRAQARSSSRPPIRSRRSSWRCRGWSDCANSRPRRWPISTSSGCSPP